MLQPCSPSPHGDAIAFTSAAAQPQGPSLACPRTLGQEKLARTFSGSFSSCQPRPLWPWHQAAFPGLQPIGREAVNNVISLCPHTTACCQAQQHSRAPRGIPTPTLFSPPFSHTHQGAGRCRDFASGPELSPLPCQSCFFTPGSSQPLLHDSQATAYPWALCSRLTSLEHHLKTHCF